MHHPSAQYLSDPRGGEPLTGRRLLSPVIIDITQWKKRKMIIHCEEFVRGRQASTLTRPRHPLLYVRAETSGVLRMMGKKWVGHKKSTGDNIHKGMIDW